MNVYTCLYRYVCIGIVYTYIFKGDAMHASSINSVLYYEDKVTG